MPRILANTPGLIAAVVAAMVAVPAALVLYRRGRGREPRRLTNVDVFLGLGVGLVVSFGVLLARALAESCFASIDLGYLVRGIDPDWHFGITMPVQRGGMGAEIAALLPVAGLHPERWGLVILAVHLVNAGLVYALARSLGVERRWSVGATLVFVGVPGLADNAFCPSNLTELLVQTAFLMVTLGYHARARAPTRAAWAWLMLEVIGVILGVGNKESFIVYPGLLVAWELTLGLAGRPSSWRAHLRATGLRLLPHLVLAAWVLVVLWPQVFSRQTHTFDLDFSPVSVLRQLARSSAALTMPWIRDRGDVGAVPWAALLVPVTIFFRLRRGGPALRFLLLYALVVIAPVAALGNRFDGVYGYHLWPAFAVALAVGLSTLRTAWLPAVSFVWLGLLALLWGGRPAAMRECAVPRVASAAAARVPDAVCGESAPSWTVPRDVVAAHLGHWRRIAATRVRDVQPPDRPCLLDRRLDDARCWTCLGGGVRREARFGEEANPVEFLRQLLAARCRRLDVHVEPAGAPASAPRPGGPGG
jgi:hypothetical protein